LVTILWSRNTFDPMRRPPLRWGDLDRVDQRRMGRSRRVAGLVQRTSPLATDLSSYGSPTMSTLGGHSPHLWPCGRLPIESPSAPGCWPSSEALSSQGQLPSFWRIFYMWLARLQTSFYRTDDALTDDAFEPRRTAHPLLRVAHAW
jgi:hypothetical protein